MTTNDEDGSDCWWRWDEHDDGGDNGHAGNYGDARDYDNN